MWQFTHTVSKSISGATWLWLCWSKITISLISTFSSLLFKLFFLSYLFCGTHLPECKYCNKLLLQHRTYNVVLYVSAVWGRYVCVCLLGPSQSCDPAGLIPVRSVSSLSFCPGLGLPSSGAGETTGLKLTNLSKHKYKSMANTDTVTEYIPLLRCDRAAHCLGSKL